MAGHWVQDAARNAAKRCQVDHRVRPNQSLANGIDVEDRALDERQIQILDVLTVPGREIIEDRDIDVVGQSQLGQARADKAGSSRDQQAHGRSSQWWWRRVCRVGPAKDILDRSYVPCDA